MAVQDIIAYWEANKKRFSLDELSSQLRSAGYPEAEIQEALKRISFSSAERSVAPSTATAAGERPPGKKIGAWALGFFSAIVLNGAIAAVAVLLFLIYAFGGFRRNYGIPIVIMAVGAALLIGEILLIVKLRKRFPYFIRGLIGGIAGIFLLAGFYYVFTQVGYRYFSSYRSADERQYASDMYSRDTRRIADIKQLQLALELYFDARTDYPYEVSALAGDYIPAVPVDPFGSSYVYENRGPRHYYLAAQLEDAGNPALAGDVNPGNSLYEVEVGASAVIPKK